MATTLAYVLQDRRTNRQARILAEFRESEHILQLFAQTRLERDANRALIEATLATAN